MRNKTTTIRLTPEMEEMIEKIRVNRLMYDRTSVIRYCLLETYNSIFLDYKALLAKRANKAPLTEEEKVAKAMSNEEAKAKAKTDMVIKKGREICEVLDGTEIAYPNGSFGCSYKLYEKIGKTILTGARTVPFDMLGSEHVQAQYVGGTKEEIIKILKKQAKAEEKENG